MSNVKNAAVHSTSGGKLFIREAEFFGSDNVKGMVRKLINSSVYKDIKTNKGNAAQK